MASGMGLAESEEGPNTKKRAMAIAIFLRMDIYAPFSDSYSC
jgi:hypothetical protein